MTCIWRPRRWVLSVPKRVRYSLERKPGAVGGAPHFSLGVIETHLRENSPKGRGSERSASCLVSAPRSTATPITTAAPSTVRSRFATTGCSVRFQLESCRLLSRVGRLVWVGSCLLPSCRSPARPGGRTARVVAERDSGSATCREPRSRPTVPALIRKFPDRGGRRNGGSPCRASALPN
jgi:hypothetical protein